MPAESDASTAGLVRHIQHLRGAELTAWRTSKGILFDKDGTLVDFQKTWFAIGDLMALQAAGGDRARADELMTEAGYDFAGALLQGRFGLCRRHQCRHRRAVVSRGEQR